MNRPEALALVGAHADEIEPATPCPVCVQAMFPRVRDRSGGPDWRPGLRFSEAHHAWLVAFGEWESSARAKEKLPPIPPGPLYVPCEACNATGVLKPGEGPWHDALAVLKEGGHVEE
jgi:hypothetical protein